MIEVSDVRAFKVKTQQPKTICGYCYHIKKIGRIFQLNKNRKYFQLE